MINPFIITATKQLKMKTNLKNIATYTPLTVNGN